LRWWEETLIFVSGLLVDDAQSLNRFLSVIVYGVNLLESEQTFLVARCLMEGKQHMSRGRQERSLDLIDRLERQVIAALVWRLNSRNEPRALHRSRAAYLLGQLASASAIEHLAQTAYGKPRQDRHGEPDFDYSNVRMAAVVGLLRMTQVAREELLNRIDPVLVELLHSWQKEDIDRLTRWLHSPEDRSARSIAALALGDLHMQLLLSEGKEKEADAALCELANAFLCPEIDEPTLWAVTYALAMLDLPIVRDAVFLPFFERERELFVDNEQRLLHYKCMGYLIGLLRWQEQKAYDFLVGSCLKDARKARLAAVAIQALGSLADRRYKPLLDMIALGNFTGILPHVDAPSSSFAYLQRKAIDALGKVGDLESVALLREHRRIEEMGSGGWDPALERALYRTSEEIFWRLNWNLRV
jgi:HEAT repeat protein